MTGWKVPATKPYFSEEDIGFITEKFKDILRGNSFLTMHKYAAEFESKFAAYIGTKFAVGCNSGTSALEMICRALKISGKEVILPSNTFVASANAVLNAGAIPVFADCGDDLCLDAADVGKRITSKTAAIMTVHIGGIVSNGTLQLQRLCRERGIHFIEDAAQAHGSSLNGIKAGAFGVASGFSFFSTKVMTTGEGGMVATDNAGLASEMKSLREFGKVPTGIYINYYRAMGYNWRMPEVAALMGLRQLQSLDVFVKRRQEIAKIYDEELYGNSDIVIVHPPNPKSHNYFKYMVILPNHDRADVHKALVADGIQPSGYVYELPLHRQPVFPEHNGLSLPKTEYVCARHLCLPIFYGMTDEQAHYVASSLKRILEGSK
ncbi:TPA: DegT/DnrJ/EryC1/StrS family aminotransferase [Candidatus Woesearchaeota archaeon]|nr:DegT/DnrJ/EryC1/StrS family aminotransferase [Candidatus Woesearchaeota archaeon]